MPLTRSKSTSCVLSFLLFSFLFAAANVRAQSKPARPGTKPARAGRKLPAAVIVVPGDSPEYSREITISLNPCKGETPGNVLGVSEQLETPRRVAAFVAKLRDPDPKARACAARQLGYLGAEAKDALPHIIRRMREEEHRGVGVHLSDALWAVGPDTRSTVDEWLKSIKADDAEVRLYGAFALGYYRPHPARQKEVVAALAAATRDADADVRWMAVKGLMRLGPIAADAIPDLLAILADEKSHLRHLAALALGNIGPEARDAAPELLKAVYTGRDFTLYTCAAIALGKIGPAVVPLLEKDLKTNHTLRVLDVLEHLSPNGAPLVIEALRMNDKEVRSKATGIIGQFGPAASPAVPLLIEEFEGGDEELRQKAIFSLYELGPVAKAAAPALFAALGDKDDLVKCYAAKALGTVGADRASVVPELRRQMSLPVKDGQDMPQRCAAETLMEMGPEAKALVPPGMAKRVREFNRVVRVIGADEVDATKPKPKEQKPAAPGPPGS